MDPQIVKPMDYAEWDALLLRSGNRFFARAEA
jgi:hypothetical protein